MLHLALDTASDNSSGSSSSRKKKEGGRQALVLGDARLVDYEEAMGSEEGQKGGREGRMDVWFPPGFLAIYMHDGGNGQKSKHQKKRQENGKEEGGELPTHPREVDLKRVLEDLQMRT